ncbi:MAG TPA: ATP-binding protein, partial [Opitutaceae bacterium]|nr:ATP-binding protein [Opitutaceae bacterium]
SGSARRIDVAAVRKDDMARVSIRDYGPGIAPEVMPRMFEPFVQANADSTLQGGLGLGLAVVRELVTLHGGTVEVASGRELQGSEFVLHVPLATPG